MSKSKNPLYSLGGTGGIGNSISFTRRRGVNIAEKRPKPFDQQTLSQIYHRWLYEDYFELWKLQTTSVQADYRSKGARRHLTGFQYWMSYQLTYLPDIVGWWPFDLTDPSTAKDLSRNHNDGTVTNTTRVTGPIYFCVLANGVSSFIDVPQSSSLQLNFPYTIECFIEQDRSSQSVSGFFFQQNQLFRWYISKLGKLYLAFYDGGAWRTTPLLSQLPDLTLLHIAISAEASGANTQFRYYENGVLITSPVVTGQPVTPTSNLVFLSSIGGSQYFAGRLDNAIFYNRVLDITEIKRHSLRRYP